MITPDLFTPVRLGALEAPNRIIMAPLTRMRAGPGRVPTPFDDLKMICFGGRLVGHDRAWKLTQTFLTARFKGAERFRRGLAKVAGLESDDFGTKTAPDKYCAPWPPNQMTIQEAVAVWRNEGTPN